MISAYKHVDPITFRSGNSVRSFHRADQRSIVAVRQFFFLQQKHAIKQCLGRRRTTGRIYIYRHNAVATAHPRANRCAPRK